jgi:hypothetical protein
MPKTKPKKIGKTILQEKTISQEKTIPQEKTTKIDQEDKSLEINKKLEEKEKTLTIEDEEFTKKYDTKLKEGKNLTFEDIESIIQYTKEHINNQKFLDSILIILDEDIKLRNKNSGIDCIEKLYEYNELLSKEFRLKKPKQDDKKALIREKLRAIIMDNYRKEYNSIGKEFIDNQITYKEHKKRIDILDEKTFSILLKVKVITQS